MSEAAMDRAMKWADRVVVGAAVAWLLLGVPWLAWGSPLPPTVRYVRRGGIGRQVFFDVGVSEDAQYLNFRGIQPLNGNKRSGGHGVSVDLLVCKHDRLGVWKECRYQPSVGWCVKGTNKNCEWWQEGADHVGPTPPLQWFHMGVRAGNAAGEGKEVFEAFLFCNNAAFSAGCPCGLWPIYSTTIENGEICQP